MTVILQCLLVFVTVRVRYKSICSGVKKPRQNICEANRASKTKLNVFATEPEFAVISQYRKFVIGDALLHGTSRI